MAPSRPMQLGKTRAVAVATAMTLGLLAEPSLAATIDVVPADDPGVGFNDPTTVPPVGGNTETTRGAQALAAFKLAASLWGAALDSAVPIEVSARFGPLECTATTGVVGSGTPRSFQKDVAGGDPGVWYPVALANRLAGKDLAPTAPDIDAVFNGAAGSADCLAGNGWYLGLDRNSGNLTDLVTAVVHELGHGLGMTTPVDLETGALREGLPDVFSEHLIDERTGKRWSELTDAGRAESARAYHQLSWGGSSVTAAASTLLARGMPVLTLGAPLDTLDPAIAVATFGPALTATPVLGVLSTVSDDTVPPDDACGTVTALTGKVAFIEAGTCTDVEKVLAAQTAGAIAAVLVSAQTTFTPLAPTGDDGGKVTIPSIRINQKDATTIRSMIAQGPSARLWANPMRALGTSVAGRVYLDATDPVVDHVSVAHWDPMASPHLLMQPTLETTRDLDLTLPLMHDLGWRAYKCGDAIVEGTEQCDDGPDGGASCTADCKSTSGAVTGGGTGGSPGTNAGQDGALVDASPRDARPDHVGSSSDALPPPNRFADGGSRVNVGPTGIAWVPHSKGCDCRVGARAGSEPAAGLVGVAFGLAAFARRRRAAKKCRA